MLSTLSFVVMLSFTSLTFIFIIHHLLLVFLSTVCNNFHSHYLHLLPYFFGIASLRLHEVTGIFFSNIASPGTWEVGKQKLRIENKSMNTKTPFASSFCFTGKFSEEGRMQFWLQYGSLVPFLLTSRRPGRPHLGREMGPAGCRHLCTLVERSREFRQGCLQPTPISKRLFIQCIETHF